MNRDPLYDDLADLWRQQDPAPDGFADRMVDAVRHAADSAHGAGSADRADGAADDTDLDYELLVLVSQEETLVGARGLSRTSMVLEFANRQIRVLVRVSGHRKPGSDAAKERLRLDIWVTPGDGWEVTARQGTQKLPAESRPPGRFEVAGLSRGLTRLVVRAITPQGAVPLETEPFVL